MSAQPVEISPHDLVSALSSELGAARAELAAERIGARVRDERIAALTRDLAVARGEVASLPEAAESSAAGSD